MQIGIKSFTLTKNNHPAAENSYWLKEIEPLYKHREPGSKNPFWTGEEVATWDTYNNVTELSDLLHLFDNQCPVYVLQQIAHSHPGSTLFGIWKLTWWWWGEESERIYSCCQRFCKIKNKNKVTFFLLFLANFLKKHQCV